MDALIGLGFLGLIIVFAVWRQKVDRVENGPPTRGDRKKTLLIAAVCVIGSGAVAYASGVLYMCATAALILFYQFAGVGRGKLGKSRQLKDGIFLGWVAGSPFCIYWLLNFGYS